MDRMPTRLLLDGTHAHQSGLGHGVQRVVRKLCEQLPNTTEQDVSFRSVTLQGSQFAETNICASPNVKYEKRIQAIQKFRGNVVGSLPGWYTKPTRAVCSAIGSKRLERLLLPPVGRTGLFSTPLGIAKAAYKVMGKRRSTPAKPGQGDILVLPDAYWAQMDIWPAVAKARENGAYIVSLVHDLIPLSHPHFVDESAFQCFEEYVEAFATHSDLVLTVSTTVRDTLRQELPKLFPGKPICTDIRASHNGAEIGSTQGPVRESFKQTFEDQTNAPFLMVSTFDPRKNHEYALDAFDLLWNAGGDQKLFLIGGTGPHCQAVLQRIANHPKLNEQLFVCHDASDAELVFAYRNARAAVFPSIIEGFGLPIVEAESYGKKVFASDTPVHREVGSHCTYSDLSNASSLADLITTWHREIGKSAPPQLPTSDIFTWQDSAALLYKNCLDGFRDRTNASILTKAA